MNKGMSQAVNMIVILIVAAAVLFLAMKLVGYSNKTVDKTLKNNQLELVCMPLGVHLADSTQDKEIVEIDTETAKTIGRAIKNLGCKKIWEKNQIAGKYDLEAEASKCETDPSKVKGCGSCSDDPKKLCLTLENEIVQNLIKVCNSLRSAYINCKSHCPSKWMQCLTYIDENDEKNILKSWCVGEDPKEKILSYECSSNT